MTTTTTILLNAGFAVIVTAVLAAIVAMPRLFAEAEVKVASVSKLERARRDAERDLVAAA